MDTTKITIRVIDVLNNRLNQELKECFIKRDQFVAHLIESQLPSVRQALKGRRLSTTAKRYISGNIKRADSKIVNLTIRKDVVDRLNVIVKESNLVRDALINRILFFAVVNKKVLERMGLPTSIEEILKERIYALALPISPVLAIKEALNDPLFYVREAFEIFLEDNMFLYSFHNVKFKGIDKTCFSCFLEDVDVPGTKEHAEQEEINNFLLNLFL
jgi:hypothetical protein